LHQQLVFFKKKRAFSFLFDGAMVVDVTNTHIFDTIATFDDFVF